MSRRSRTQVRVDLSRKFMVRAAFAPRLSLDLHMSAWLWCERFKFFELRKQKDRNRKQHLHLNINKWPIVNSEIKFILYFFWRFKGGSLIHGTILFSRSVIFSSINARACAHLLAHANYCTYRLWMPPVRECSVPKTKNLSGAISGRNVIEMRASTTDLWLQCH